MLISLMLLASQFHAAVYNGDYSQCPNISVISSEIDVSGTGIARERPGIYPKTISKDGDGKIVEIDVVGRLSESTVKKDDVLDLLMCNQNQLDINPISLGHIRYTGASWNASVPVVKVKIKTTLDELVIREDWRYIKSDGTPFIEEGVPDGVILKTTMYRP